MELARSDGKSGDANDEGRLRDHLRELSEEIERAVGMRRAAGAAAGGGASPSGRAGGPPKNQNAAGEAIDHHLPDAPVIIPLPPNASGSSVPMPDDVAPPRGVRYVSGEARIADFIDHTLLKAEATAREIDTLCEEAKTHRFAAVCVNPSWVERCARHLQRTDVQIATVIGFPLGATSTPSKRAETELAVNAGATELDMVIALGKLKSGEWSYVADDIAGVVDRANGKLVKVIIESATLTPVEIVRACIVARAAGAHYVKTSTGFHAAGGATAEAVALMRLTVGDALGVKASGGVRDCLTASRMIASGATRIGTSSGVAMAECKGPGPRPLRALYSIADSDAPTAALSSGNSSAY